MVAPNPDGIMQIRMRTEDAISANVPLGVFVTSLTVLGLLYAVLLVFEIKLLCGYIKAGPNAVMDIPESEKNPEHLTIAY